MSENSVRFFFVFLYLLFANKRAPEHTNSLADHANLELLLCLEPVDDLLQRRVVIELESIPERPFDLTIFALLGGDGLGETEER